MNKNLAILAIATTFAVAAQGSSITFTGMGTSTGGNVEDATATVTTTNGFITVMLTNLEANPTTAAQSLSDFFFTVSGVDSLGTLTQVTPTGSLINIAANGTVTSSSAAIAPWGITISGTTANSTTFYLNDLIGPQLQTIIGPSGPGGVYSNADGSIAGNGPHNPFLDQTATFTFAATGVTSSTTISSAIFSFGTTSGNDLTGTSGGGGGGGGLTPEPGSIGLMVIGALMLLGGRARHNRRRESREY